MRINIFCSILLSTLLASSFFGAPPGGGGVWLLESNKWQIVLFVKYEVIHKKVRMMIFIRKKAVSTWAISWSSNSWIWLVDFDHQLNEYFNFFFFGYQWHSNLQAICSEIIVSLALLLVILLKKFGWPG